MPADPTNPSHYKFGEYELWPIQHAWLRNILRANAYLPFAVTPMWFQLTKYLFRFPLKSDPLTDLKKARWMLDKMISNYEEESPT